MHFDGGLTNEQGLCDLSIREAGSYQVVNLHFSLRQLSARRFLNLDGNVARGRQLVIPR